MHTPTASRGQTCLSRAQMRPCKVRLPVELGVPCPRAIPALSKAYLLQKGKSPEGAHCIRGMWEEDVVQPSNWVCVCGGGWGSVLPKAPCRMQWGPGRPGFLPISSQLSLPMRPRASHCTLLVSAQTFVSWNPHPVCWLGRIALGTGIRMVLAALGTLKSVTPGNPQDGSAGMGAAGWTSVSFLFYSSFFSYWGFYSALGRWQGGSGVPTERKSLPMLPCPSSYCAESTAMA